MTAKRDWKADVIRHGRATGAADLPAHTVEELAAHLEDIYLEAIRNGRSEPDAHRAASAKLKESPLGHGPGRAHPDAGVAANQRSAVGARAHWSRG